MKINSIDNLRSILDKYNIPITKYGQKGKKNLQDLFKEITRGESLLVSDKKNIIRYVNTVAVIITYNEYILIEKLEVTEDGSYIRRHLTWSIAEKKISKAESDIDAISRGFYEELGMLDIKCLHFSKIKTVISVQESPSYPGLKMHNTIAYYRTELPYHLYKKQYIEKTNSRELIFEFVPIDHRIGKKFGL